MNFKVYGKRLESFLNMKRSESVECGLYQAGTKSVALKIIYTCLVFLVNLCLSMLIFLRTTIGALYTDAELGEWKKEVHAQFIM